MRIAPVALSLALVALPALAQDRTPAIRQTIVDLAYVIGESHALRQACQGADDQYWRTRMIRLVEAEQPDEALDRRLRESFNTGFASRQSEFPTCTAATRRAEVAAASRGQSLAAQLSQVMNEVRNEAPPTIADMTADGASPTVGARPASR